MGFFKDLVCILGLHDWKYSWLVRWSNNEGYNQDIFSHRKCLNCCREEELESAGICHRNWKRII
jgi:hypothetical protein